jgi:hypothetical protein
VETGLFPLYELEDGVVNGKVTSAAATFARLSTCEPVQTSPSRPAARVETA